MLCGRDSAARQLRVVGAQFAAFSNNGKGWGPGRIDNLRGAARTPNSTTTAADLGQTLALSGSGLGNAKNPVVWVGGRPAKTVGTRDSAAGQEILFRVPENAPEGCFVPVQVHNAGELPSNTVTVAIRKGGGACREPEYFPSAGWSGARFGIVTINRTILREHGIEPVLDEAGAWFGRLPGLDRLNPYFLLPPPGTCTSQAEAWRGEPIPGSIFPLLASHSGSQALRGGENLTFHDGKTVRRVQPLRGLEGLYDRELSDFMGRADRLFEFLSPAAVRVASKGGSDVGPFSLTLRGVEPFEMRGQIGPVRRGRPLRLEWSGMDADHIAIVVATLRQRNFIRGDCRFQ